jgi:hypothetical protein
MTNHPKDRHVVAAAVECGAHVIVTSNLKDFPPAALLKCGLRRAIQTPFYYVFIAVIRQRSNHGFTIRRRRSAEHCRKLLRTLAIGVPRFAAAVAAARGPDL